MPPKSKSRGESMDELRGWKTIADFFQVSARTIRRWHREFSLPIYKIKNSIFLKVTAAERWKHQFEHRRGRR